MEIKMKNFINELKTIFFIFLNLKKYRLLIALERVKKNPIVSCGICTNVLEASGENMIFLLNEYFVRWPKYSGHIAYPVPSIDMYSSRSQYELSGDMWAGEYGKLRMELLDFIIEELIKELDLK
jgi:hypothetical protein